MTALLGIIAVVLTIAIIFGRRVAARLVIFGVVCCIAYGLWIGGYILYMEHREDARTAHLEFAMSHLPAGTSDADKEILRKEFKNYFAGLYDKQYVPDLDMIDQYLQGVDPSLVRHK